MANSRAFLDSSDDNDHAMVTPMTELRDSLGFLAVQILAARVNLADMDMSEALQRLYEIIEELHKQYEDVRTRISV